MKLKILPFIIIQPFFLLASNLELTTPILYQENGQSFTLLNVSWENTWNNEKNHDAVWLFFKLIDQGGWHKHIKIAPSGHNAAHNVSPRESDPKNPTLKVTKDGIGLFIIPPFHLDNINLTLKIILDPESLKEANTWTGQFKAYGIEMVYIPEGGFTLGDPDTAALAFGAMYTSDSKGNFDGLFEIKKENQVIKVAPEKGALYYRAPKGYEGDQTGEIPATFPKGVQAFYIMKYEPTQGQYVDFLNSLNEGQSQMRANFGGKKYYEGGSIRIKNDTYIAEFPNAPCTYMSWDDAMAYADWAGLRPMTEFEYTKSCRGPERPIAHEFPWNTASKDKLQMETQSSGKSMSLNLIEFEADQNREENGASYYWVMDLAGSMWERVITIGHPKGRAFTGTHGDGKISSYGYANNPDWPSGIQETGGFGYRGGGFYGFGRGYNEFNPFSPIAYRRYGGWSGGNRTRAYGARFVRTAD